MHSLTQRMMPVRSRWTTVVAAGLLTLGQSGHAQSGMGLERKPTVAVMEFDNAAMIKKDQYEALTVGVQVMLANAIAANPKIEVIERQKIQALLAEQNLTTAGRVDAATAAKVGKLLGAKHMLMGAFVVDPSNEMRLSIRSVNTETSAIEYVEEVTGKGDKIFKLIDQLAAKVNTGLKLPGIREPKAVKELGADGPNQLEALKAFSAAQRLEERGDFKGAAGMYQKSLALNSDLGTARTRLAMLDTKTR